MIFNNCTIQGSGSFYLGRPWQNDCNGVNSYPKTVFLNTTMSSVILPAGWLAWDNCTNTSAVFYAEYNTKGVSVSSRVSWSKQLTSSQASTYARSNVFSGWDANAIFSGLSNARVDQPISEIMEVEKELSNTSSDHILSVYPNPSADVLHISAGVGDSRNATITIRDLSGRVIFSKDRLHSNSNDVDVSHLPAGTYVLTLTDAGRIVRSLKISKQ